MSKRKHPPQANKLLNFSQVERNSFIKFSQITGTFKICLAFLFGRKNRAPVDNEKARENMFIDLCKVSTKLRTEMCAVQHFCFYPTILCKKKLQYFHRLIPQLSHVRVNDARFAPIFTNLQRLTIGTKHAERVEECNEISIKVLCHFDFPILQKLSISQAIDDHFISIIAATCLQLRILKLVILRNSKHILICNFPRMEKLSLMSSQHSAQSNIYINQMPCLTALTIQIIDFKKLQFGLKVRLISKIVLEQASFEKLIFQDEATLTHLNLGDENPIKVIDPFQKVHWHLKYLSLVITEFNNFVMFQHLHSIETLQLWVNKGCSGVLALPWNSLNALKELHITLTFRRVLQDIMNTAYVFSNLQVLEMQCDDEEVFDCCLLMQFPNITTLDLTASECDNIEYLFRLKNLGPHSRVRIDNLEEDQKEKLKSLLPWNN